MSKLWIFINLFQILFASDAEDFNPLDHILRPPPPQTKLNHEKKNSNEIGQPKVFDNERCVCTCPSFDIPNVAKSVRQVYIGLYNFNNHKLCAVRSEENVQSVKSIHKYFRFFGKGLPIICF